MKYVIDKNKRPAYLQLYRQIRDDVVKGLYPFGSKLPSKRLLASELDISTVTVEHAYALLSDEGYAEPRERSGLFVRISAKGLSPDSAADILSSSASRTALPPPPLRTTPRARPSRCLPIPIFRYRCSARPSARCWWIIMT